MQCIWLEITCEAVESTNATVDYTNFQVGGLAKYSCGKGKFLLGDATRQCSDRGKWSGQSPTCQCNFAHYFRSVFPLLSSFKYLK